MRLAMISGHEVIIDDEDAMKVAEYGPWYVNSTAQDKVAGRIYFAHNLPEAGGKRQCVKLHRVISGAIPGQIVDHVNGNTLDCRKCNLRVVDSHINAVNVNSVGRGVTWDKQYGKWRARIQVNKKSICLGRHTTREDADAAYRKAEEYYGYTAIRSRRIE